MPIEQTKPILTPLQALCRYHDELHLQTPEGRMLVLPGVIGTVFFERGSKPDVRQGILQCFDRFEELFGKELRGGRAGDRGKFTKKTAAGLATLRREIVETSASLKVEVARSSAIDQDTAAEYGIKTLTDQELPFDLHAPGDSFVIPQGSDFGTLSYLKFNVPMSLVTSAEGLALYEDFLRFVCHALPVRGGYGGLSSILPFSFHRFMPQEYELALRFSGLEIDSYAFVQDDTYLTRSYEGESSEWRTAFYPHHKPGAKVLEYGFVKCVNWYTLLGDVFVDRLGGEDKLRADLSRPDIGIERIDKCLLVRAGPFPRLGAPEEGLPEPYVFVNSVLRVLRNPNPGSLHSHIPDTDHANLSATQKWQARFDLPGAAPLAQPPAIVPQPRLASTPPRLAAYAGDPCPQTGYWEAPRLNNRREHVERGQPMPGPASTQTGAVVWYLVAQ